MTIHQTDLSRAFFKVDNKEQSPNDDQAVQEKDGRLDFTLSTIQVWKTWSLLRNSALVVNTAEPQSKSTGQNE